MMDACVEAFMWTIDENTTRIEKNQSIPKDEDSIFVQGKCKKQTVNLTYIFKDDSNFNIADKTWKVEVRAFTENSECQKPKILEVRDDYSTDLDEYSSKSEGVVVPKIKVHGILIYCTSGRFSGWRCCCCWSFSADGCCWSDGLHCQEEKDKEQGEGGSTAEEHR